MRQLHCLWWFAICALVAHGAPLIDDYVIAPRVDTSLIEAGGDQDAFANCPAYILESPLQVFRHGDFDASRTDDFQATLRTAWNENGLFLRYDVVDDVVVPVVDDGAESPLGDYLRVGFRHRTVGAYSRADAPWSIYLFPDPDAGTCQVRLIAPDPAEAARLQVPEARLIARNQGYTLIVRIADAGWEDRLRPTGALRFQTVYADADDPMAPATDHLFTFFPVKRGAANPETDASTFGELYLVHQVWVNLRPADVLSNDSKFHGLLRYGNLGAVPLQARIDLVSRTDTTRVVKPFPAVAELKPGTHDDGMPIELDLSDLQPHQDPRENLYRLRTLAGLTIDPRQPIIHKVRDLVYVPELIEYQTKPTPRNLAILANPVGVQETFRYLAGGGKVLWSVGAYDGSSADFPGHLRTFGSYTVEVPAAKEAQLPYALFGGLDRLDGMSEPLNLKLSLDLFQSREGISPQLPEFDYIGQERLNRRLAVRSKRLLMIGFVYDYVDPTTYPVIEVHAGKELLTRQALVGTPHGGPGQRHAYVLRLWLEQEPRFSDLTISNVATYGPRAEIDFMALMGAGTAIDYEPNIPSLRFRGTPEAEMFTRQLAVSLFFLRHYFIGQDGTGYDSLPGGRQQLASDRDMGMLMEELAAWGQIDQVRFLASTVKDRMDRLRQVYERTGELTMGHPALLLGLHELWRKREDVNIALLWLPMVHRPINDLINSMAADPLRLVEGRDAVYGIGSGQPAGASMAMSVATQACLQRAAEMAASQGWQQNAQSWQSEASRLGPRVRDWLQAPAAGLSVSVDQSFPASYGLPAQDGVHEMLPQGFWLHGRYRNRQPVLYNGDVRVYDTPYVFSALPFYLSQGGMQLDEATRLGAQVTLNYLYIVSPLFQATTSPVFFNADIIDYHHSDSHLLTTMAALLLDNRDIASKLLNAYIRYTFDEYAPLPVDDPERRADIEVSPYTFEQRLNVSEQGENLGASGDDLNIQTAVLAMKNARIVAGIDDTDASNLKLYPRLPNDWRSVEANRWLVSHNLVTARATTIDYRYTFTPNAPDAYTLNFKPARPISQVTVRIGPFDRAVRRVELRTAAGAERLTPVVEGGLAWVYRSYRNVSQLDIAARVSQ